ncbi:LVIVD repeat-containing protein [Winogradskyella sp. PG-2]|uniref:LVIVD repeat-containing protein n=1 Tax=Winogradskyella sp. PG-2 TaxID=754409 RepID=UPI0004585D44|nr:hypothetical protein [Winogradskyella sp. PG-2]BAO76335.1 hypothetical protein WPG_2105 [Winogradskyella sp. PG-2]
MKKIAFILLTLFIWSCNNDDQSGTFTAMVAIPETITKTEWRSRVEIQAPKPIEDVGKIYSYEDYIFIGEKFKGVHVINNSNPLSPTTVAFINIPGNEDISIKNNYLYADNSIDLVVFDISDINAITEVERLEDVFYHYFDYRAPEEAYAVDFENFNFEEDVIVGWAIKERQFEEQEYDYVTFNESAATNDVGVGGSLARFQIVNDYLYTVGESELSAFNISNLSQPSLVNTYYAGWSIETMFYADGYLYLGGTNGMSIHSIADPASPQYISDFDHWEGCDPVVVDGDYAYLTLRGGNECGQELSVLEVIDVSDKYNPTLVAQHFLDSPYGLGFKESSLFVCDGAAGLKIYDKSNPLDLQILNTFENVNATDVIPLEDKLLMISENALYQYQYNEENSISLMSTFILN